MDNRRTQITTAIALVVVAIFIGYFFFLRGALAERRVPTPDSADYSVAQASLRADSGTAKASKEALDGGDLEKLLNSAAPDGMGLTVQKTTKDGAVITVSGTVEQIFGFLSNLSDVRFETPLANGENLGQIRGSGPLITINSMKLANDTGTDSASASIDLTLAKREPQ